jgi:hypothetical protein
MERQWLKVWTQGGHVITGTVQDARTLETLRATLAQLDSNVPGPIAASAVIRIPQDGQPPVQVVLNRIEAWLIEPEA